MFSCQAMAGPGGGRGVHFPSQEFEVGHGCCSSMQEGLLPVPGVKNRGSVEAVWPVLAHHGGGGLGSALPAPALPGACFLSASSTACEPDRGSQQVTCCEPRSGTPGTGAQGVKKHSRSSYSPAPSPEPKFFGFHVLWHHPCHSQFHPTPKGTA